MSNVATQIKQIAPSDAVRKTKLAENKKLAIYCILLTTLFFSFKSIFAKMAYAEQISPISLLAWRSFISLPFFLLPMGKLLSDRPRFLEIKNTIVMGIIGGSLYLSSSMLDFIGLTYIDPSIERTVLFTYPIFVIMFSWKIGKKLSGIQFMLIITSQIGLLLMFMPTMNKSSFNNSLIGVGLVLLSALMYALFMIFSGYATAKIGIARFTSVYMCVTCLLISVVAIVLHTDILSTWNMGINKTWIIIALAIVSTVIPSYLMSFGIHNAGARMTAIISGSGPIITLLLDRICFGRILAINEIVGSIIVAISITIMTVL